MIDRLIIAQSGPRQRFSWVRKAPDGTILARSHDSFEDFPEAAASAHRVNQPPYILEYQAPGGANSYVESSTGGMVEAEKE